MDKKKQIERYQLEKFVSNAELNLQVYEINNCETPDFEVRLSSDLVSIEISRLINPDLQKVEQYRDKIITTAQHRFERKYSDKLYTLVTFKNIVLQGGALAEEKYVCEVFDLVEKIYLNNRQFKFSVRSKSHEDVSETIEDLSVDNIQNFSHWQHFGAYLVPWIDWNWLKQIIEKKEKNIGKYKKEYKENWLLLISDFGTEASTHTINTHGLQSVNSQFNKIFIYSFMADEIMTIK